MYRLLLGALRDLDTFGSGPWLRQAFTLRVLNIAGFGFRETAAGPEAALWETLHDGSWEEVRVLKEDCATEVFIDGLFSRFFAETIGADLRTLQFVK